MGHCGFCPPALKCREPQDRRGDVASLPTCGPLLISFPKSEAEALGTPGLQDCRGYVANLPSCGPFLILSHAVKCWGPPRRQRLCRQSAYLWATADLLPHSCWGPPKRQQLCSQSAPLWAIADFVPCFEAPGPPGHMGYAANLPTCGGLNQKWPTSGQIGYTAPTVCGGGGSPLL